MTKMGDLCLEWVLLHARNGEHFSGMVEVPADLKETDEYYKRCLAAELLQPKIFIEDKVARVIDSGKGLDTEPVLVRRESTVDRIIELRNPHQVIIQAGQGKQVVSCIALNYGDRLIFLRSAEFMFAQFLDAKSPIVVEITMSTANLVSPGKIGEERTGGGIIIPTGAATK